MGKRKKVYVIQHFKLDRFAYTELEEAEKVLIEQGYRHSSAQLNGDSYSKGSERILITHHYLKGEK